MKCLIVINSYLNLESQEFQNKRFIEEFKKENVEVDVLKTSTLIAYTKDKTIYNLKDKYDFCLFLDKDKYVCRLLENLGIRVFNNSKAIENSDDKMLTHIELAKSNIKMPITIPGLLCMNESELDLEYIDKVIDLLKFPIVVKECYGSLGKNVYLANNREELIHLAKKVMNKEHLFQQFISSSFGKDIRVCVVGDKVVGCMLRESNGDFRSNVAISGKARKIKLDDKFRDIAIKTSKALDLDFCGIDLLIDENNNPLVCEVNPKMYFNMLEKVTGVNVANKIVKYIIKSVK